MLHITAFSLLSSLISYHSGRNLPKFPTFWNAATPVLLATNQQANFSRNGNDNRVSHKGTSKFVTTALWWLSDIEQIHSRYKTPYIQIYLTAALLTILYLPNTTVLLLFWLHCVSSHCTVMTDNSVAEDISPAQELNLAYPFFYEKQYELKTKWQ